MLHCRRFPLLQPEHNGHAGGVNRGAGRGGYGNLHRQGCQRQRLHLGRDVGRRRGAAVPADGDPVVRGGALYDGGTEVLPPTQHRPGLHGPRARAHESEGRRRDLALRGLVDGAVGPGGHR